MEKIELVRTPDMWEKEINVRMPVKELALLRLALGLTSEEIVARRSEAVYGEDILETRFGDETDPGTRMFGEMLDILNSEGVKTL